MLSSVGDEIPAQQTLYEIHLGDYVPPSQNTANGASISLKISPTLRYNINQRSASKLSPTRSVWLLCTENELVEFTERGPSHHCSYIHITCFFNVYEEQFRRNKGKCCLITPPTAQNQLPSTFHNEHIEYSLALLQKHPNFSLVKHYIPDDYIGRLFNFSNINQCCF